MLLKPQDIVIALKVIAIGSNDWKQSQLAHDLCMSISEINAGLKRLQRAKLFVPSDKKTSLVNIPNTAALEEFILHGIKYVFIPDIGEITRGVPTSYGAPLLGKQLALREQLMPVWPHSEGNTLGYGFSPLFKKVPESILKHPDNKFYDLLVLVDAIRHGQARETKLAKTLISKLIRDS